MREACFKGQVGWSMCPTELVFTTSLARRRVGWYNAPNKFFFKVIFNMRYTKLVFSEIAKNKLYLMNGPRSISNSVQNVKIDIFHKNSMQ